jgi:hypothetical protein
MQASEHAEPDWKVSWPLQCLSLDGVRVTVMVGVIRTADGGERVALRVGGGAVALLPIEDAAPLLSFHLRQAISERIGMRHPTADD